MRLSRLALAVAALVLVTRPTYAQGFFTPYMGYNFGGDSVNCASLTDCQDKNLNIGIAFGSMGRAGGFEQDISYAKHFFGEGTDSAVLTVMSNLVIGVSLGPAQPYFVGGIGLVRPHASPNPLQVATSKNAFGYDLGGGVNVFFSRHAGMRGDLRRFQTFQDITLLVFSGEKLSFWRATVGLTLR